MAIDSRAGPWRSGCHGELTGMYTSNFGTVLRVCDEIDKVEPEIYIYSYILCALYCILIRVYKNGHDQQMPTFSHRNAVYSYNVYALFSFLVPLKCAPSITLTCSAKLSHGPP